MHYHAGNFYNFSAAVASNDTSAHTTPYEVMPDSICPKGWKLPQGPTEAGDYSDFYDLLASHEIVDSENDFLNDDDGPNNIRANPLFFVRAGSIDDGVQYNPGFVGSYLSSSVEFSPSCYYNLQFFFTSTYEIISTRGSYNRFIGSTIRCLAR